MLKRPHWSNILLTVFVAIFLITSPPVLIRGIESIHEAKPQPTPSGTGIIVLWHIDAWEGGQNSRSAWLMHRSREYEKKHKYTYFYIRSYSPEQAKLLLDSGSPDILPDIISFSPGIITNPQSILQPLTIEAPIKRQLLNSGIKDKLYAIPWLMGGYGLMLKKTSDASYESIINNLSDYKIKG
ncbi:MAG TPA: hypothetical protein PLZ84_01435, partial [Clostridia bacterium]|nr:hypothetical protein [Clostridia bacterium]